MNIRGGWLTIINVARTMTAWHGASGSILTVDRSMALMVRDFNVFNGTVEELQAFVDGIKETP